MELLGVRQSAAEKFDWSKQKLCQPQIRRRCQMAEPRKLTEITVKDIMAKNPATLDRNDTLEVAEHVMTLGHIRHMPVVDKGRIVGVVSQRDLFRSPIAHALGYGRKAQRRITMRVSEVMKRSVMTICPDSTISAAAGQMIERKIGCLPVVEHDRLVGIITETDILRYVAEHPSIDSTPPSQASPIDCSDFVPQRQ
jgi:CBS domain-containing membrane protein